MKIHFISIGGSVMHQLAIALHKKGYEITGTDDEIFEPAKSNLEKVGLLPSTIGWQPNIITNKIDAIILGMHAKENNPELLKAKELNIPIYSFPEYIYKESLLKKRVAVGGSHGKTTTTSMIMHVLKDLNYDFDYLVGAKLNGFSQSVSITNAPTIICEADEYPASAIEKKPKFHFLNPNIAILTGIAWDHINIFPTFDIYVEQFKIFIDKIEQNGLLIYNQSDTELCKLINSITRTDLKLQPYSTPTHNIVDGITNITIDNISKVLKVFGNHNLQNIYAAYYVCKELGINTTDFLNSISSFTGASKRLELIAHNKNTSVFRDFAHAPSKVKATLKALKQQFPTKKLVAVFELHTFSSLTSNFLSEYNGAMDDADLGIIYYSKHVLERKKLPMLQKDTISKEFSNNNLLIFDNKEEFQSYLPEIFTDPSSVIVFMSSGIYDGLDIVGKSGEYVY